MLKLNLRSILRHLASACLLLAILPLFGGCESADGDPVFYVKYVIDITATSPDADNVVGIKTQLDENPSPVTLRGPVHKEIICGPVVWGFKAAITPIDLSHSTAHSFKIYVAQGSKERYALKAQGGTDGQNAGCNLVI